jgi:oxygen-independent coproporphyrinogen-3 oxidase
VTPVAVYVHIPFCTVKCGYCDFNAYAGLDSLKETYARALLAEVEAWGRWFAGRSIATVSFGGGTPGESPADHIAAVVEALRRVAPLDAAAEVGLEANPGSTTLGYLEALRRAGVNRLSLGAQSFDPSELRLLDRIHSPEAIEASARLAREAGIAGLNLDLIYGIPGQSLASWARNLDRALALRPDHLSCYGLTVEDRTPLAARVASGAVAAPDQDAAAAMYELAEERLAEAGFVHYELSNWGRPGYESRHNLAYWTDRDYLGLGAGAHGYLDGLRYENAAHPRDYISRLSMLGAGPCGLPGPAIAHAYRPTPATAIFDWLETRLRLVEGFPPDDFAARFGLHLESLCSGALASCLADGLLESDQRALRLTPRGRLLHSEVCARLLAALPETIG